MRMVDVVQTLERAGLHDIAVEASRRFDDPVDDRELATVLQSCGVNSGERAKRPGRPRNR